MFVWDAGERLLRYVYWSNGREMEELTTANKQCAGKDLVEGVLRVYLAEFFLRDDTFTVKLGKPTLQGPTDTVTSLVKTFEAL